MKYYDTAKAKQLIEEHKETVIVANLFMSGDYEWTAETVWYNSDGYLYDLENVHVYAGLIGSHWATPMLQLVFGEGMEKRMDCYLTDETITPELLEIK